MNVADYQEREQALDPALSFIVQAPAGSGKTELLVRRFLVLLANVKQAPEEIIAITFTKKAAAEMRQRILDALQLAENLEPPIEEYKLTTWQLARAVLMRDEKAQWHLRKNPSRLRIQTIDSLCSSLTKQMPLLSGFGAQPNIAEDATPYYLQAARALLNSLESDAPWAQALENLLLHLDNNFAVAEHLFIDMLARRDQWLPYVVGHHNLNESRQRLEAGLAHIIIENMQRCREQCPIELIAELVTLARFAGENLFAAGSQHTIIHCKNLTALPPCMLGQQLAWQGLAELLLTKEFQWRKQVDVRVGFPSLKENKTIKVRMTKLLKQLLPYENFRQTLQTVLGSPPRRYSTVQWQVIEILIELLPILVAQLTVIFRQQGIVDFNEISIAALKALGEPEAPTELALYLDHQIQHILVDEFQDTSITQFRLLEQLTIGWQPYDGRTLFLVGDPMQSIYRFREAEVGLFLKAKQEGIGNIQLNSLTLTVNFRSQSSLVNWVNEHFTKIFPSLPDISTGAIPFTCASALHNETNNQGVYLHSYLEGNNLTTANNIVTIINEERLKNPQGIIAILVRSRSHLLDIIPILKKAELKFSAIEIEKLSQQPIIHDLTALTRALLHPADRIAWLAVLRAPWCGLILADLYALVQADLSKPIWANLIDFQHIAALSADGQQRLKRIVAVFTDSISNRRRLPLRQWIEGTWLMLGGPACLLNAGEFNHAQAFFNLLEELEQSGDIVDLTQLEGRIAKLYAMPDNETDNRLQIMTLHKAKGLEFDTVIIPGLEYRGPFDKNQLLMWMERPRAHGENDLILAPIKSATDEHDPIYTYLRDIEKMKSKYETARLLYVGVTRAKCTLHLLSNVYLDEKQEQQLKVPSTGSFLALFWQAFKDEIELSLSTVKQDNNCIAASVLLNERKLHRLKSDWQLPDFAND
jgi:ATP-dependent helicase/nuclease subunit A